MEHLFYKRVENSLQNKLTCYEFGFLQKALTVITKSFAHRDHTAWKWSDSFDRRSRVGWASDYTKQRAAIGVRIFIPKLNKCIEARVRPNKAKKDQKVNLALSNSELEVYKSFVCELDKLLRIISDTTVENVLTRLFNDFNKHVGLNSPRKKSSLGVGRKTEVAFPKNIIVGFEAIDGTILILKRGRLVATGQVVLIA
jgi:hypothetical protein